MRGESGGAGWGGGACCARATGTGCPAPTEWTGAAVPPPQCWHAAAPPTRPTNDGSRALVRSLCQSGVKSRHGPIQCKLMLSIRRRSWRDGRSSAGAYRSRGGVRRGSGAGAARVGAGATPQHRAARRPRLTPPAAHRSPGAPRRPRPGAPRRPPPAASIHCRY